MPAGGEGRSLPPELEERARAGLGGNTCSLCGGAGWLRQDLPLGDPNFGKIVKCSCKEREEREQARGMMVERSRLGMYRGKTFPTFHPEIAPSVGEAFRAAQQFAHQPEGWLVLSGPVGCGKTHLAAAIANSAVDQGESVLFTTVPELMDHLREAFAPTHEVPYHELFDEIRQVYLLVLDDLGVEHSTPWVGEKLFQIVNYRYNEHMPTVFTVNADTLKTLDARIRSRLTDIALARICTIKAPDYRPRNAPPKPTPPPNP
jgi:DNA replication protein DnaC